MCVCVLGIKRWFGTAFKTKDDLEADKDRLYDTYSEAQRLKGRKQTDWREEEIEDRKTRAAKTY